MVAALIILLVVVVVIALTACVNEEMLEKYKCANPFDLVSTQPCPLEEIDIELIGLKEMYDKYLR